MNVEGLVTSDYLGGQDCRQAKVLTITAVELREMDDGEQKVALEFNETSKQILLNKTRLKAMMGLYGPETNAWLQKRIMLTGRQLSGGKFSGQWTVDILEPPAPVPEGQPEVAF